MEDREAIRQRYEFRSVRCSVMDVNLEYALISVGLGIV